MPGILLHTQVVRIPDFTRMIKNVAQLEIQQLRQLFKMPQLHPVQSADTD